MNVQHEVPLVVINILMALVVNRVADLLNFIIDFLLKGVGKNVNFFPKGVGKNIQHEVPLVVPSPYAVHEPVYVPIVKEYPVEHHVTIIKKIKVIII